MSPNKQQSKYISTSADNKTTNTNQAPMTGYSIHTIANDTYNIYYLGCYDIIEMH